jgi:hypothetical protein
MQRRIEVLKHDVAHKQKKFVETKKRELTQKKECLNSITATKGVPVHQVISLDFE